MTLGESTFGFRPDFARLNRVRDIRSWGNLCRYRALSSEQRWERLELVLMDYLCTWIGTVL